MNIAKAGILAWTALWLAGPTLAEEGPATDPVRRAAFTSGVEDREPVDRLEALSNDNARALFFTELVNLAGQTVVHRWEFQGRVMAEVPFTVGGDRWRVWSSKELEPAWLGEWTVSVVDGGGAVLRSEKLLYAESAAATPPASPADPPAEVAPPDSP